MFRDMQLSKSEKNKLLPPCQNSGYAPVYLIAIDGYGEIGNLRS